MAKKTYFHRLGFVVLLVLLLICGIRFLSPKRISNCNRKSSHYGGFDLSFIPEKNRSCEKIVPNIPMSRSYVQLNPEFQLVIQNAAGATKIQGHSAQAKEQYKTIHYLAGHTHVKTACETGFNFGHSSFNYLTANDQLIVHSFDAGYHKYLYNISDYMKKKFQGRFFIHLGDSKKILPKFVRNNPNVKCDLMFVDGGHEYPTALADVKNFARIANLNSNVILFDDYPTDYSESLGKAWNEMVKAGVIEEKMRCTFITSEDGWQRGYTIGRFVKRSPHTNLENLDCT